MNSHFSTHAINFLSTLGWNPEEFEDLTSKVTHSAIDGLIVRRPSYRTKAHNDPAIFVLDWDGRKYPHKGLDVEAKTIDTTKPQWQKAVMLWYTRAVFKIEQIKLVHANEQAEADAKRAAFDAALHDAMPEDCKVGIEDLHATGSFGFDMEKRAVIRAEASCYLKWRLPEGLDAKQSVEKLARLTRFLIEQGFTHH